MNLYSRLQTRYPHAKALSREDGRESVEVFFPRRDRSVVVIADAVENRYSASYPELVRDGRGGWTVELGFSKNMLIDGVLWILRQVDRHGEVRPEVID